MRSRSDKGTVYLVGAGPGDPRLITLRGMQCLERADVIVYDRLVSPRLLRHAKEGAELIYVGKLPDQSTLPQQEKINQLLIEKALAGQSVCRLKGGDPSIFAYVGEEAECLVQQGIDFEIVPGISSALAVPVYAGIPVTYRNMATSVQVITGHEDPYSPESLTDWATIAQSNGTLVILMGIGRIKGITDRLLQHGKNPQTPVAVIRWGTVVEQETLMGTLENVADRVQAADVQNPAIIVIGDVVNLREKIQWFEKKPLFGQRIVVTRSRSQASELVEQIEELGGEPVEFPVIRTTWPEDLAPLDAALARVDEFDWIIFTSVNGVEMFFDRMKQNKVDIRSLYRAKLAAVGLKTANALEQLGLVVTAVAEEFVAEGLLKSLEGRIEAGQQVLLPRANIARKTIPDALRAWGCVVTDVDAYQTQAVTDNADEIVSLLQEKAVHVITFTSASTVNNFFHALTGQNVPALLAGVTVVAIGPITAKTATELGLNVDVIADTYTIDGLVDALVEYKSSKI